MSTQVNLKNLQECKSCINLNKKIKIVQADHQFQQKKYQEDISKLKAMHDLTLNRQIKKLIEKLQKEKEQRQKDNFYWEKKYDQLDKKNKVEIEKFSIQKEKETQKIIQIKQKELKYFKQEKVTYYQSQISNLKKKNQIQQKQMTNKHNQELQKLKKIYQQKITTIISQKQQLLKKKSNQYQSIIVGIQSQKNVQENLHKKTKQQSKQYQAKIYEQIYFLKKNISQQQQKILNLKKQIKEKCLKIQDLINQSVQKQNGFNLKYKQLENQYKKKHQQYMSKTEKKLQFLFKKQLDNCQKYQKALQKIQQKRDIENQMYKANLENMKNCIEERPSRTQDVDEINILKEKLLKRQRQLQSMTQNLKNYKLELQNKEETFIKIFGPQKKKQQPFKKQIGRSLTSGKDILQNISTNINQLGPLGQIGCFNQKKIMPPINKKLL